MKKRPVIIIGGGPAGSATALHTGTEPSMVGGNTLSGERKDDVMDLFSGRIYGKLVENNQARAAMRCLMSAWRADSATPEQGNAPTCPPQTGMANAVAA